MTVGTFAGDLIKELILSLVIVLPLIYLILFLMNFETIGNYWWVYVWAIISLFSLIMMWIYPSFIAPIFNKFNPLDNETLKARITNLLERAEKYVTFKNDRLAIFKRGKLFFD